MKIEDVINKFGKLDVDPITVDEKLKDRDKIKSLKVIHTPGHTPGHISLYLEAQRTLFGADVLWNMRNSGGLGILPPYFTLALSVTRISQLNFDILLLGHQDNPILENAQNEVEMSAKDMIRKLKQTKE